MAVPDDRLNGWIIHLCSSGLSQTPTVALLQLFPPSGMLLSQISPLKNTLTGKEKEKGQTGCLDCNFDQQRLARYLDVIKTMKQSATHFHFLHCGYGWIKVTAGESVNLTLTKTQTCFLLVASWHSVSCLNWKKESCYGVVKRLCSLTRSLGGNAER